MEHVRSLLCSFYVIVCGRTNIQHVTMAGKTKDMSQIKQLLLLKKEGVSNRKAAEIVGINKETANNYVRKALADRLGIDGLLKLDDPVLEHRLKGGNPAYTDSRFEVFKELLPYLQEEMRRKHVTLKLLWEEYVEEHPDDHYSLTQFRFHYSQNTEAKKESPSTVLVVAVTNSPKQDFNRCKSVIYKSLSRDTKSARDKNGTKPRKNKVKNTLPEISLVEYLCFVCKGTNLSLEKRGEIPISLIHNSFSYHCTPNVVIASDFDLKQHDLRKLGVKFCFALCWTFAKTRTGNRTKDLPPLLSNTWFWECLNDRHLKMLNFK